MWFFFLNSSQCAHIGNILFTWYSDDYRLCAFGVVSEYLLPELADALQVYQLELEDILHHYPPGKTWC